jgi:hypothetical protein
MTSSSTVAEVTKETGADQEPRPALPAEAEPANSLFVEQYVSLRQEILQNKAERRTLLLEVLRTASAFLSVGLVNYAGSGIIALIFPIIALFLAGEWVHDDDRIRLIRRFLREQVEEARGRPHAMWELYRNAVDVLVKLLKREKRKRARADFEQLLQGCREEAALALKLPREAALPRDIVQEASSALALPGGLVQLSARGVFLSTQLLAWIVGGISVAVGLMTPATWLPHWALICLAAIFVPADAIAMVLTWRLLRHRR